MLSRTLDAGMPAARVTADEAYGKNGSFRGWLEQRRTGYIAAVPKSHGSPRHFWRPLLAGCD